MLKLKSTLRHKPFDCSAWKSCKMNSVDIHSGQYRHHNAEYTIRMRQEDPFDEHFEQFESKLFRYKIFPPHVMDYHVCSDDHLVDREQTYILQRLWVGPWAFECAVVVTELYREANETIRRSAFRYTTLEGHPEIGIADFILLGDRQKMTLNFRIESWSKPHPYLRLFSPFARFAQSRGTKQALEGFFRSG